MKLQTARGVKDFSPDETIVKNMIVNTLKQQFESYGFNPIETPIIERFDILSSKYAGGDEILKETFQLKDQGKRDLGLRYDLTIPLSRFIGMNPQTKMPFKVYQIGNVFRDGPVSLGRYRQFKQCDIDIIGCNSMIAESELISVADKIFDKLGFKIVIRVNNRKLMNSYLKKAGVDDKKLSSAILSIDKLEKFGIESVKKELKEKKIGKDAIDKIVEIVSITGSNKEKIKKISKMVEDEEGLNEIKELLDYCDCEFNFDLSLARGLSYYTGTIYEIFLKDSSIKSAVCSGGRYDNLIDNFIGTKDRYQAVGISFGLDRIYDAYKEKNKDEVKSVSKVFIIPIKTLKESLDIAKQLRKSGINTDIDMLNRGPSKNLDFANSLGIPYCIFIGPKELEQGKVKLRDMKSGDEKMLAIKDIVREIK